MTQSSHPFDPDRLVSAETRKCYAEAQRICQRLCEAGHVAYFAGGCVRDALLGRQPKDFDVATDATPERVRQVFGNKRTLAFGASFGVIGVLPHRQSSEQSASGGQPAVMPTEVATFRSDGEYSDGRRPDKVSFGDARNDAFRRDFTINGLFYDPAAQQVIDFVGGQEDLEKQVLRTIGRASERFEEDKLRMLRAVRFATTLGFMLDDETHAEMTRLAPEIAVVSGERIGAEMRRILVAPRAASGLRLLVETGLDQVIWPTLRAADAVKLNRWLEARQELGFESTVTLILLAISGTDVDAARRRHVDSVANDWRLSSEEKRRIRFAIESWQQIAGAADLPWSSIQPLLINRDIHIAIQVAAAITTADRQDPAGVEFCRQRLSLPPESLNPAPLLTGDQLRAKGYRPGPQFRVWLKRIRDAQLDGEIDTTDQALRLIETDQHTER